MLSVEGFYNRIISPEKRKRAFGKCDNHALRGEVCMENFLSGFGLPDPAPLQKALFEKYGPADRRHKKPEATTNFRVDQCEMLTGADGKPLSHVCTIFVRVDGNGALEVWLGGNVPLDEPVQAWIKTVGSGLGATSAQAPGLSFVLKKGQQESLLSLAKAMKQVVVGRRYSTPSYKYTCPRVADALKELKGVLDGVWT